MISSRVEDYLRTIFDIIERKGYVRTKDLADELGVRPPSVTEMLKRLDEEGLVVYERYSGATLTPRGKEIAVSVGKRHDTFMKLLDILLVPKDIARKDAHILEHSLDPKTIEQFTRFVEFIMAAPTRPRFLGRWSRLFRRYCETGEFQK